MHSKCEFFSFICNCSIKYNVKKNSGSAHLKLFNALQADVKFYGDFQKKTCTVYRI